MNQLVKKNHAGINTCAAIKYDMKYNKWYKNINLNIYNRNA